MISQSLIIRHFICLCGIGVLCGIIYSNTLHGPFVFDDIPNISDNRFIRVIDLESQWVYNAVFSKPSTKRPIANLSFALNYFMGGYDVVGYHLINIVIHFLCGVLVYFIALLTFKQLAVIQKNETLVFRDFNIILMAVFSACIFISHPIQTQSVTYIVQRMNSMATMFYLLSLLSFILVHNVPLKWQRWLLWLTCLGSWFLALGSKQIAATLPIIILLYEYYFFQDLNKVWIQKNIKYFIGLILLLLIVSFIFLGGEPLERILFDYTIREFTLSERILTQFRILVYYISLLFYPDPSRLNLLHHVSISQSLLEPITTLFSLISLVSILGLAIYVARRHRLISFCIIWFFINLLIESSFIGLELIFEHRLYLPMFGFALVISYLLFTLMSQRPKLIMIISVMIIICLSSATYARNKIWSDEKSLWTDVVNKNPLSHRAHYNLANTLKHQGLTIDAINHYGETLKINPFYDKAYNNLGVVLKQQGYTAKAIEYYNKAIDINPSNAEAHNNLGLSASEEGKLDDAINHYSDALKIDPYYTKAHFNIGNALELQRNLDEAIVHYNKAKKLDPYHIETYNNLGIALARQGKLDDAIAQFSKAIQIDPQSVNAQLNSGLAQVSIGNIKAACSYFKQALKIKPDMKIVQEKILRYCSQSKNN
jgi:tetratricopeptide (TPR) repeat protein